MKRPHAKGMIPGMRVRHKRCLALFYCQKVPVSGEQERLHLEKKYGESLRLFPIPCSGRLEPIHLLRALETFADVAYVITCPEGKCRYFEGNHRAKKRVERTRAIITEIGMEAERVGVVVGSKDCPKTLAEVVEEIFADISKLKPSPVQHEIG